MEMMWDKSRNHSMAISILLRSISLITHKHMSYFAQFLRPIDTNKVKYYLCVCVSKIMIAMELGENQECVCSSNDKLAEYEKKINLIFVANMLFLGLAMKRAFNTILLDLNNTLFAYICPASSLPYVACVYVFFFFLAVALSLLSNWWVCKQIVA